MELNQLQKTLLEDSTYDDMGLWVVIWEITKAYTTKDPPEIIRREAIGVIREMLRNGWIVIGTPINKDGEVVFQLFHMSVDRAIEFIEREWDKLDRFPNIGEVCWFRATPAGIQLANELGLGD
jgi:hypothetical protein